jgi:hypothetical protein
MAEDTYAVRELARLTGDLEDLFPELRFAAEKTAHRAAVSALSALSLLVEDFARCQPCSRCRRPVPRGWAMSNCTICFELDWEPERR